MTVISMQGSLFFSAHLPAFVRAWKSPDQPQQKNKEQFLCQDFLMPASSQAADSLLGKQGFVRTGDCQPWFKQTGGFSGTVIVPENSTNAVFEDIPRQAAFRTIPDPCSFYCAIEVRFLKPSI